MEIKKPGEKIEVETMKGKKIVTIKSVKLEYSCVTEKGSWIPVHQEIITE